LLELATEQVAYNNDARRLARSWIMAGVRPIDAMHLASAATAQCDVLLTTDDKLIKRVRRASGISSLRVENPLEFVVKDGAPWSSG